MNRLKNRCALITGASFGLGLATAKAFAAEGSSVVMNARHSQRLDEAVDQVTDLLAPGQRVLPIAADVSDPGQVEEMVEHAVSDLGSLQILVSNAAILGPIGDMAAVDWEEWVNTIRTNLLGSVLVARSVLPHFTRQRYGKIIQLSGGGATGPRPRFSAYAASKSAVVRVMETLALEVREHGIDVNCVAPGAMKTQMQQEVLDAGEEVVGRDNYERTLSVMREGVGPAENAAQLIVYLASRDSDGLTGKLISAVWDPWTRFSSHMESLASSDVYTLRRIVPEDRGMDFDGG